MVMRKLTTIYTKICVPKFIIFELWNSKDKELEKKKKWFGRTLFQQESKNKIRLDFSQETMKAREIQVRVKCTQLYKKNTHLEFLR